MSKQIEFKYMEAKELPNMPVIEMNEVKEFARLANDNLVKHIFKITGKTKAEFFFPYNGVVYKIAGDGFLTLADMQQAQNNGFPGAKEYYEAKKTGIDSYQEYLNFSKTGPECKEDYEAAAKGGFTKGLEKFKEKYSRYQKEPQTSVIPADIDNAVQLYKYALEKGIKSYEDFEKIYDAGFPDDLTYNDSTAKGFANGKDYFDASKKGFSDPKEYREATKLHIENKKDYDEYRFLKDLNTNRDYTYDQLQLLIALSNSDNGTVLSIADTRKLLQNAQEKLKKVTAEGQKVLPVWYRRSIDRDEDLVEFLKKNEELKKFGFFNTAKKSFEVFKASAIKILVDGSNVAHNGKAKPDVKNIKLLIDELKFWKFKNIIVFVDASLRHKIKQPAALKDLEKECEFYEAPSRTAADEFLIASVKKERCLVVSNDEFRDWKAKDKWAKDKLDSIRVKFRIIKGDKVILTDMEKLREKLIEE